MDGDSSRSSLRHPDGTAKLRIASLSGKPRPLPQREFRSGRFLDSMTVLRMTMAAAVIAILSLVFSAPITASEELSRAKTLYQSAAYDDALSVLDGISDPEEA